MNLHRINEKTIRSKEQIDNEKIIQFIYIFMFSTN